MDANYYREKAIQWEKEHKIRENKEAGKDKS